MFSHLPPVTRTLILVNVAVFFAQFVIGNWLVFNFALWPLSLAGEYGLRGVGRFQVWQVITYAFLHGGLLHLMFNMLALFMFGSEIERAWGQRRYLVYYFGCIAGAAVAQLIVTKLQAGPAYPTLGASGGVFGLLLAFGMLFPRRMILLIFPPIPMPAWLFVTVYGAIELVLGVTGTQAGVAHFAHLGGMAAGFAMIRYWRGRGPFRPRY
jgi:membrane associated rhomboid family serine protease